jgi:hypothetical protein
MLEKQIFELSPALAKTRFASIKRFLYADAKYNSFSASEVQEVCAWRLYWRSLRRNSRWRKFSEYVSYNKSPELSDFIVQHTKMGKKYTKRPLKMPNINNVPIPKFSTPRPSKIFQNWDFWYENIPSGNPGKVFYVCCSTSISCRIHRLSLLLIHIYTYISLWKLLLHTYILSYVLSLFDAAINKLRMYTCDTCGKTGHDQFKNSQPTFSKFCCTYIKCPYQFLKTKKIFFVKHSSQLHVYIHMCTWVCTFVL